MHIQCFDFAIILMEAQQIEDISTQMQEMKPSNWYKEMHKSLSTPKKYKQQWHVLQIKSIFLL